MKRTSLAALLPFLFPAPAIAQMDHSMPSMNMPGTSGLSTPKPVQSAKTATQAKASRRRQVAHGTTKNQAPPKTGSAMAEMPGMDHEARSSGGSMSGMSMRPGMDMSQGAAGASEQQPTIPKSPEPPPPADHAADRFYDPALMAAARSGLREENGGGVYSKFYANIAEVQPGPGGLGYRWDVQAWFGGDINRFVVKSEGSGTRRGGLEEAELQALYSRAVGPYTDVQAGVRYDFKPTPSRVYGTIGVQTLFPYQFEFEGALFVSNEGEVLGRLELSYDLLLTQRLVLQPRAELNFAAQNSRDIGVGSGLSTAELGLRLRYEFRREFAPYIGVTYEEKVGRTGAYARADGEDVSALKFVTGIRTWF